MHDTQMKNDTVDVGDGLTEARERAGRPDADVRLRSMDGGGGRSGQ